MGTFTSKYTGAQIEALLDAVPGKQATLVSGSNIKTVNNESLLGSGNITIQGGGYVLEGEYENEVFALTEGTFSDAYAQLEDGKSVYLRFTSDETGMSGLYLIAEAVYYNSTTIVFALDLTDANYIISIHCNGLGSVTRDGLQPKLVSGTNIKTINNQSVLGSGNINIEAGETDSSMSPTSENPVQNKVIYAQLAGKVGSETVDNIVELTKAQYDALATKDPGTLYIITDAGEADGYVSITGFEQTQSSSVSGGNNVWTVYLSNGQSFNLTVKNGEQGNTGSSVAYPYELINNLTTNDPTKGLSAAQGKVLAEEISAIDDILDLESTPEEQEISIEIYKQDYYLSNGGGGYTPGTEIAFSGRAIASSPGWKQGDTIRISYLKSGGTSSCAVALYKNGTYIKNLLSGNGGVVVNSITEFTPTEDFDEVRFTIYSNSLTNITASRIRGVATSNTLDAMSQSIEQIISATDDINDALEIGLIQVTKDAAVSIYKDGYYINNGTGGYIAGQEVAYSGRAIASSIGWSSGDTIRVSYLYGGGTSSCAIAIYKNGVFVKNLLTGNGGVVINSQTDFTPSEEFDEVRFSIHSNSTDNISVVRVTESIASEVIIEMQDDIDELKEEQQVPTSIKILCFGNSFTQDAVNYSPWIFKGIAPDVQLDITMAYISGCTLAQHCANITGVAQTIPGVGTTYNPGVNYSCYHYINGATAWSSAQTLSAASVLALKKWDVITFQMNGANNYGNYSVYYEPFLGPTFKALAKQLGYPFKLGWILTHGSYTSDISALLTRWQGSAENSQNVLEKTPVDFLIPYGTAIQNLRTTTISVGNRGAGSLLADDVHLQEGIATLCASYSVAAALLSLVGRQIKLIGEETRPDSAWISGHNCPGGNYATSGVVEGVTDDNCYLAQFAAIAAQARPFEVTTIE